VAVHFHDGLLVMVVMVFVHDRPVAMVLLDAGVRMVDIAVVAVAVNPDPAGADVHVPGERTDRRQGDGGSGGERDLYPRISMFRGRAGNAAYHETVPGFYRSVFVSAKRETAWPLSRRDRGRPRMAATNSAQTRVKGPGRCLA
jgi:hypothetical protein